VDPPTIRSPNRHQSYREMGMSINYKIRKGTGMKPSKYVTCCFVGLFFLGFLAGGRVLARDMYKPVISAEQAAAGYEAKDIEPLRPDSSRWIQGVVVTVRDTQVSCYVSPTYYDDVIEVNLGFLNLSDGNVMNLPDAPVESVYADGTEACGAVDVDSIIAGIDEKEKAEIASSEENTEGEGLLNPVARKVKYGEERKKAEGLKQGLYEASVLKPGEKATGKLYFNAEKPGRVTVSVKYGGKALVFDFARKK